MCVLCLQHSWAEIICMSEADDMAVFIFTPIAEHTRGKNNPQILPIICVTDYKSQLEAVESSKSVTEKQLQIEISGIKES